MEEILAVDERDGALERGLCRNFGPLETITPPGPCGRSGGEEVERNYKVTGTVFQEPIGLPALASDTLAHAPSPTCL